MNNSYLRAAGLLSVSSFTYSHFTKLGYTVTQTEFIQTDFHQLISNAGVLLTDMMSIRCCTQIEADI